MALALHVRDERRESLSGSIDRAFEMSAEPTRCRSEAQRRFCFCASLTFKPEP